MKLLFSQKNFLFFSISFLFCEALINIALKPSFSEVFPFPSQTN